MTFVLVSFVDSTVSAAIKCISNCDYLFHSIILCVPDHKASELQDLGNVAMLKFVRPVVQIRRGASIEKVQLSVRAAFPQSIVCTLYGSTRLVGIPKNRLAEIAALRTEIAVQVRSHGGVIGRNETPQGFLPDHTPLFVSAQVLPVHPAISCPKFAYHLTISVQSQVSPKVVAAPPPSSSGDMPEFDPMTLKTVAIHTHGSPLA